MNIFKNLFLFKKKSVLDNELNILKNPFLFNKKTKKTKKNKDLNHEGLDHYKEISKLVKEARIKQNLTIKE